MRKEDVIKTKAASSVLQLMDSGCSYSEALDKTLLAFDDITKEELELELNLYI